MEVPQPGPWAEGPGVWDCSQNPETNTYVDSAETMKNTKHTNTEISTMKTWLGKFFTYDDEGHAPTSPHVAGYAPVTVNLHNNDNTGGMISQVEAITLQFTDMTRIFCTTCIIDIHTQTSHTHIHTEI